MSLLYQPINLCYDQKYSYKDIRSMCHQYDIILFYIPRSLLQGKTSHKFIDLSENPIMRVYYTSKPILFFMCAGNEAFYAALYLLHFTEGPIGMFIITGNRNPL